MTPKKWALISKKDISPSKWFPIEERAYELPNGKVVNDFSVTTLADVAMVIPITNEGKIVMVNQFKPGFDDVILEFPAGRIESSHNNLIETAKHELEEETGIVTSDFEYFATFAGFVTKATEKVSCFLAKNVNINSVQKLDDNEDIEVILLNPEEVDKLIFKNIIQAAITISAWEVAKKKFPELFNKPPTKI